MATVTIPLQSAVSPDGSYIADPGASGNNLTWAQLVALSGTSQQFGFSGPVVRDDNSNPGKYGNLSCGDITVNLNPYNLVDITAVSIRFPAMNMYNTNIWSTSERNGFALVIQDETLRGTAKAAANYDATVAAFGTTEICTRVPASAFPVYPATVDLTLPLNATGVSYFQSLKGRLVNPGYAFLGVAFAGYVDGETPTFSADQHTLGWANPGGTQAELILTCTTSTKINIGDTWRDVVGASLNVTGSAWSDVTDMNLNVSDVWKDRA